MQQLTIHTNIQQGSDEWHRLRLGKITASCFYKLLGTQAACDKYLYDRANEIVTNTRSDSDQYSNIHMQRGCEYESIAREMYTTYTFTDVEEVGLIQLGDYIACSPDGLIGDDGMIEIKVPDSNNYFRHILDISEKGKLAITIEHYIQMQFCLYVGGRKWCDYVLYNPKHALVNKGLFIYRVELDNEMQERIHKAVENGIETIGRLIAKYRDITKSPIIL